MKFKVGDLVRVREDLVVGKRYGIDDFIGEMRKYKGKIFNIIKTTKSGKYYLEGCGWYCFTDEMLEEANPNDFIKQFLNEHKELFKNLDVAFTIKNSILDEVEKRYLRAVIRPFRDRVICISKVYPSGRDYEYIEIEIRSLDEFYSIETLELPCFKAKTMYKGMEDEKGL